MILSPAQNDALKEIVNIGFGRAAASLSMLVGRRILLTAPEVELYSFAELQQSLAEITDLKSVIVHQAFSGQITGNVLLFMEMDSAAIFIDLLSGSEGKTRRLSASDREALLEVGNILLNAYVGSFGNLLKTQINFSLPQLQIETLENKLNSFSITDGQDQYSLLVKTDFTIESGNVGGYVALVVGNESFAALVEAIETEMTA